MIKNGLLLLLMTLLFTACMERNQTLVPNINTSIAKPISKDKSTSKSQSQTKPIIVEQKDTRRNVEEIKSPISPKEVNIPQKKKIIPTPSPEVEKTPSNDNDFFTFSDETKNKISGFFVIIIGILILI